MKDSIRICMFRHPGLRMLCLAVIATAPALNQPGSAPGFEGDGGSFPFAERLVYRVEWRLITAGTANLDLKSAPDRKWQTSLNIQSAGVLSRVYRVLDTYNVTTDSKFCLLNSDLDAQENKRHVVTRAWVENSTKLRHEEKDVINNSTVQNELNVPPCTREIAGALASLRLLRLEPGKSINIPITDGKKVVSARIESQARESISFEGKKYETMRYEAFLFDNVLYRRKGRLFVWVTEDAERIPVQIRIQLGFPIGNVTIQLEKQQRSPG
ncbi:MAG: DUF3108 domain-containing protein [Bryobacteraceae bacterium]